MHLGKTLSQTGNGLTGLPALHQLRTFGRALRFDGGGLSLRDGCFDLCDFLRLRHFRRNHGSRIDFFPRLLNGSLGDVNDASLFYRNGDSGDFEEQPFKNICLLGKYQEQTMRGEAENNSQLQRPANPSVVNETEDKQQRGNRRRQYHQADPHPESGQQGHDGACQDRCRNAHRHKDRPELLIK